MALVNVERVAAALNVGARRVQQLVNEGMPRESRGQYDAVKCMLFYIRYLQQALEEKEVPVRGGLYTTESEERTRLLRADADLREIELAKKRGQLVSLADHEKRATDLVLTVKARLMSIPPRLAPELVGENSRVMIQAKLGKALEEALSVLPSQAESRKPAARRKSRPEPAARSAIAGMP